MALGITKLSNVTIESAESVAVSVIEWASDTGGTVLNAGAGELFEDIILEISVTMHTSATLGCELHLRYSVDDGTTEPTEDLFTFARAIEYFDGTRIFTHRVPGAFDYLDVGIKNLDAGQVVVWTGIYGGRKITGMA